MPPLTAEQWAWALTAAFLTGMAKGGLPGAGTASPGILANVFAAKASAGILLPVLIAADLVGVLLYRRHADWAVIRALARPTLLGVAAGAALVGALDDRAVRWIIGGLLLLMVLVHAVRTLVARAQVLHPGPGLRLGTGLLIGFSTMIANAAGPVSNLYFQTIGLPKMVFLGTAAWFFCVLNWVKVAPAVAVGQLTAETLAVSLWLMPVAVLGALVSPPIVKALPQVWFGRLIYATVVVGAVQLFLK